MVAVETEEERRARLENDAAAKRLSLAMETGEKKENKTGEHGSYHTAQIGLGDRERRRAKKDWI